MLRGFLASCEPLVGEGLMFVCAITFMPLWCVCFFLFVVVGWFGVHYFFFSLFGWLSFVFWFGSAVCSGCADSYKQHRESKYKNR